MRLAGGNDQHITGFEPPRLALFHASGAAYVKCERGKIVRDGPRPAMSATSTSTVGVAAVAADVRRPVDESRSESSGAVVEVNIGRPLFHRLSVCFIDAFDDVHRLRGTRCLRPRPAAGDDRL